jgi:hypothetical protein
VERRRRRHRPGRRASAPDFRRLRLQQRHRPRQELRAGSFDADAAGQSPILMRPCGAGARPPGGREGVPRRDRLRSGRSPTQAVLASTARRDVRCRASPSRRGRFGGRPCAAARSVSSSRQFLLTDACRPPRGTSRVAAALPGGRPLERLQRTRLVDVNDSVELARETRLEIVTDADAPRRAAWRGPGP